MPDTAHLIALRNGRPAMVADDWQIVDSAQQWEALLADPEGSLCVPLALALAHPERLGGPRRHGIWLNPADDPARAAPLLPQARLVAVEFPKFTDGRGYSTAVLLRSRYGWRGELRALGDVLQDQLHALSRVGFDSFALRADRDPVAALAAFTPFSGAYQGSVDNPLPAWRRAAVGVTAPPPPGRVASALALLRAAAAHAPATFSTSFGAEDMVLLDLIRTHALDISIFTLDTGRLPEETHALMEKVEQHYGRCFTTRFPAAHAVEALVARDGANGFYGSVAARQACCAVRKVAPLDRALLGQRAWVTGLRAGQSAQRAGVAPRERDAARALEKFNPLHDWSDDEVWSYLRARAVPYNALHDRFYPSIGCAPCTRAVTPAEDPRSGRWWWESGQARECGLHPAAVAVVAVAPSGTKSPAGQTA